MCSAAPRVFHGLSPPPLPFSKQRKLPAAPSRSLPDYFPVLLPFFPVAVALAPPHVVGSSLLVGDRDRTSERGREKIKQKEKEREREKAHAGRCVTAGIPRGFIRILFAPCVPYNRIPTDKNWLRAAEFGGTIGFRRVYRRD